MDIKLTEARSTLLTALMHMRGWSRGWVPGPQPYSNWWGLRSTTWKPLEAAGFLKSRLDRDGELHFKITAAGRRALDAVAKSITGGES
jgi:hypothetical protein